MNRFGQFLHNENSKTLEFSANRLVRHLVYSIDGCVLGHANGNSHSNITQISVRFQQFHAKDGVALAMSPLLALIFTGLLPPSIKAVLVFWRTSDVLPGHRAFSVHAEKDVRVNSTALRRFISPWPATAAEQNQAWYALSKQHADAPAVADGHRMFLLWRDITACSAVFGVIGTAVLLAFGTSTFWSIGFALMQAVQFVSASVLGRVHGERFVCNVLAEARTLSCLRCSYM